MLNVSNPGAPVITDTKLSLGYEIVDLSARAGHLLAVQEGDREWRPDHLMHFDIRDPGTPRDLHSIELETRGGPRLALSSNRAWVASRHGIWPISFDRSIAPIIGEPKRLPMSSNRLGDITVADDILWYAHSGSSDGSAFSSLSNFRVDKPEEILGNLGGTSFRRLISEDSNALLLGLKEPWDGGVWSVQRAPSPEAPESLGDIEGVGRYSRTWLSDGHVFGSTRHSAFEGAERIDIFDIPSTGPMEFRATIQLTARERVLAIGHGSLWIYERLWEGSNLPAPGRKVNIVRWDVSDAMDPHPNASIVLPEERFSDSSGSFVTDGSTLFGIVNGYVSRIDPSQLPPIATLGNTCRNRESVVRSGTCAPTLAIHEHRLFSTDGYGIDEWNPIALKSARPMASVDAPCMVSTPACRPIALIGSDTTLILVRQGGMLEFDVIEPGRTRLIDSIGLPLPSAVAAGLVDGRIAVTYITPDYVDLIDLPISRGIRTRVSDLARNFGPNLAAEGSFMAFVHPERGISLIHVR